MSSTKRTSTGHELSEGDWLDTHFESARPEYEDSLRYVGIKRGWKVLDAGCGNGAFLPLMSEMVGAKGGIIALDLAPESTVKIDARVREGHLPSNIGTVVGSMQSLPFQDSTFDCVWSANVMQYLSEDEFNCAVAEFKRVLKPGGTLAIKDFDDTFLEMHPMDPSVIARFCAARRIKNAEMGILGVTCGTKLPMLLRRTGLTNIRRKAWLVERWAPLPSATRSLLGTMFPVWAMRAAQYDIPAADLAVWREAETDPSKLMDDPDFCWREGFVVAVGNVAK